MWKNIVHRLSGQLLSALTLLLLVVLIIVMIPSLPVWKENTLRVEKVTEKQVYLESSAPISALKTFRESVLTLLPREILAKGVALPAALTEICDLEPASCSDMAVVLTSDGLLLYGGVRQEADAADLIAVDRLGEVYDLEKLASIEGFSLYQLVKAGELPLPVENRSRFFALRPVLLGNVTNLEVGQRVMVLKETLTAYDRLLETMVSAVRRNDDFLLQLDARQKTVLLDLSGDAPQQGNLIFDLAGQLLAVVLADGRTVDANEITALLERIASGAKDYTAVNLGASCLRLDKELATGLKLENDYGCLVTAGLDAGFRLRPGGVEGGTIAEKMGLRPGDLILEVDGRSLLQVSLLEILLVKARGEKLQLTVLRGGERMILKTEL